MSVVGHHQDCFQVRPHDRPARGECVRGGAGRGRHQYAVAPERRHRSPVDFDDDAQNAKARSLLQAGFVERPTAIDDLGPPRARRRRVSFALPRDSRVRRRARALCRWIRPRPRPGNRYGRDSRRAPGSRHCGQARRRAERCRRHPGRGRARSLRPPRSSASTTSMPTPNPRMSSAAMWIDPRSTASADSTRRPIPVVAEHLFHPARGFGDFVTAGVYDQQDGAI